MAVLGSEMGSRSHNSDSAQLRLGESTIILTSHKIQASNPRIRRGSYFYTVMVRCRDKGGKVSRWQIRNGPPQTTFPGMAIKISSEDNRFNRPSFALHCHDA